MSITEQNLTSQSKIITLTSFDQKNQKITVSVIVGAWMFFFVFKIHLLLVDDAFNLPQLTRPSIMECI